MSHSYCASYDNCNRRKGTFFLQMSRVSYEFDEKKRKTARQNPISGIARKYIPNYGLKTERALKDLISSIRNTRSPICLDKDI